MDVIYREMSNRACSRSFKSFRQMLKNWIFPEICCFCLERSDTFEPICQVCYKTLPWLQDACYYCGRRLETDIEHFSCQKCLEVRPNFDRVCALFRYEPPMVKFITDLKFHAHLQNASILGKLFAQKLKDWYKNDTLPEIMIPVPLYIKRLRKRGYNQALEFMKAIAKYKDNSDNAPVLIPLMNACQRIKNVKPQASLNRAQRHRNLKGVFRMNTRLDFEHVAIVDDVITTGSTVSAFTAVLKEAGVRRVDVFCACRA